MKPPPSRTMRAAFDAAAITDGSSTAIGTRKSRPLTTKLSPMPEGQRVDADGVLDHAIGGRGVDAAVVERPHVLFRQVRVQAQQLAPPFGRRAVGRNRGCVSYRFDMIPFSG